MIDNILNKVYQYALLKDNQSIIDKIVAFNKGRCQLEKPVDKDLEFYYTLGTLGEVPAEWTQISNKMERIKSSSELV